MMKIPAGITPPPESHSTFQEVLSPWWRRASLLTAAIGLSVLILVTSMVYRDAPPIPDEVVSSNGTVLFTSQDITAGQQVFLKYGLMDNGSIWGHGALLGPDFSANYLHSLALHHAATLSMQRYQLPLESLSAAQRAGVEAEVALGLKNNRYNAKTKVLTVDLAFEDWFILQPSVWTDYFSDSAGNGGLQVKMISDPTELNHLSAFVAWTAWASVTNRPGKTSTYTNNFPYDPLAGNTAPADALLWSAMSLIFLLGGTAAVLLAFGKFDYLGWKAKPGYLHPKILGANVTQAQRATLKYFAVVAFLLLAQTLVGGAVAHYRADPGTFYGFDLAIWLPSNLLRTWHLQLAIFWIATAYVAGALFIAAALGGEDPPGQKKCVNILFWALIFVVIGSLLGEWAGMRQLLPNTWFWFGHQGWEYLELGRAWQILLAIALIFWFGLLMRALIPALRDQERKEIATLFLIAAIAIPVFYLPAMFFDSTTHFSVVDVWRFWIIHLWVEGFFEFFVTVMVAIIFLQFGVVTKLTATRVIYLDAILYFSGGFIGTGHHWYWTGQTSLNMALSALFSALEVVPLTLITLDAWDFVRLSRPKSGLSNDLVAVPHKWTFYFLMAVGFWNFLGAGVFGFLINLPIVSYYETGTLLTINHGHAAM
ncbi:MAG: nitric-oxide reductase large subunit, partial [Methylophilus sp.]